ncbi:hypothetical protein [Luteimonas sp. e5]
MSKSHRSSSASASCRCEWRPSRWISAWLIGLALVAPLALLASNLPRALAWPMALLVAALGVHRARQSWRRPPVRLQLRADGPLTVDGVEHARWRLRWRGPLAFVSWHDGRRHQALALWPDVLPPALRRELRLATPREGGIRLAAGMAT